MKFLIIRFLKVLLIAAFCLNLNSEKCIAATVQYSATLYLLINEKPIENILESSFIASQRESFTGNKKALNFREFLLDVFNMFAQFGHVRLLLVKPDRSEVFETYSDNLIHRKVINHDSTNDAEIDAISQLSNSSKIQVVGKKNLTTNEELLFRQIVDVYGTEPELWSARKNCAVFALTVYSILMNSKKALNFINSEGDSFKSQLDEIQQLIRSPKNFPYKLSKNQASYLSIFGKLVNFLNQVGNRIPGPKNTILHLYKVESAIQELFNEPKTIEFQSEDYYYLTNFGDKINFNEEKKDSLSFIEIWLDVKDLSKYYPNGLSGQSESELELEIFFESGGKKEIVTTNVGDPNVVQNKSVLFGNLIQSHIPLNNRGLKDIGTSATKFAIRVTVPKWFSESEFIEGSVSIFGSKLLNEVGTLKFARISYQKTSRIKKNFEESSLSKLESKMESFKVALKNGKLQQTAVSVATRFTLIGLASFTSVAGLGGLLWNATEQERIHPTQYGRVLEPFPEEKVLEAHRKCQMYSDCPLKVESVLGSYLYLKKLLLKSGEASQIAFLSLSRGDLPPSVGLSYMHDQFDGTKAYYSEFQEDGKTHTGISVSGYVGSWKEGEWIETEFASFIDKKEFEGLAGLWEVPKQIHLIDNGRKIVVLANSIVRVFDSVTGKRVVSRLDSLSGVDDIVNLKSNGTLVYLQHGKLFAIDYKEKNLRRVGNSLGNPKVYSGILRKIDAKNLYFKKIEDPISEKNSLKEGNRLNGHYDALVVRGSNGTAIFKVKTDATSIWDFDRHFYSPRVEYVQELEDNRMNIYSHDYMDFAYFDKNGNFIFGLLPKNENKSSKYIKINPKRIIFDHEWKKCSKSKDSEYKLLNCSDKLVDGIY